MSKVPRIELLAPAGSFEAARAAVGAGADAVYMGGPHFSARAYAESSSETGVKMLHEASDYCRLRGVRFYLALNTLVKEKEFPLLSSYLEEIFSHPPDAVIVQDLGVLRFVREHYPGTDIHISTQEAVTGPRYAEVLRDLGAGRVILARELSLREIAEITAVEGIETEVFAHGALCYSYSGRCLMSSFLGGRSGNRGRCAGTCRLPFEVLCGDEINPAEKSSCSGSFATGSEGFRKAGRDIGYPLSMKDLDTLSELPALIAAGVKSLKIEGRMKSPAYVAAVVSVYRKYLDMALRCCRAGSPDKETDSDRPKDGYHIDPADRYLLSEVFDRGGTTCGYLTGRTEDMTIPGGKPDFRTKNEELIQKALQEYIEPAKLVPLEAHITLKTGENPVLTLSYEGEKKITVSAKGRETVRSARTRPLSFADVKRQIGKLGGSDFRLAELTADMDEDIFLTVGELNALRRDGIRKMREAILSTASGRALTGGGRKPDSFGARTGGNELSIGAGETVPSGTGPDSGVVMTVETREQLEALLDTEVASGTVFIDSRYFEPTEYRSLRLLISSRGLRAGLRLAGISRDKTRDYFDTHRERVGEAGFDEFMFGHMEDVLFFESLGLLSGRAFSLDQSIYMTNTYAAEEIYRILRDRGLLCGLRAVTRPTEISLRESKDISVPSGMKTELIVYGRAPLMLSAQCLSRFLFGCGETAGPLRLRDRKGASFPVKDSCGFCLETIYNSVPTAIFDMEENVPADFERLDFTVESGEETAKVLEFFSARGALPRDFTRGHYRKGF